MFCWRFRRHLNAYIDGELPFNKHIAVKFHLEKCRKCRLALINYRKINSILYTLHVPPVPEDLLKRTINAAKHRQNKKSYRSILWKKWLNIKQLRFEHAATFAALFFGLLIGSWMGLSSHKSAQINSYNSMFIKTRMELFFGLDAIGSAPKQSIEAITSAWLSDDNMHESINGGMK